MYIAFPVTLYAAERFVRALRSGFYDAKIIKVMIHPGKVLSLKLQKPEGFKHKSGMYIFIQCPQISLFQWYVITSYMHIYSQYFLYLISLFSYKINLNSSFSFSGTLFH